MLVLRGGRKLLSGDFGPRPRLLVAVHPQFLGEFGNTAPDVEQLCRDLDYLPYDLSGSLRPPVEYSEYWLIPSESCDEFRRSALPVRTQASHGIAT